MKSLFKCSIGLPNPNIFKYIIKPTNLKPSLTCILKTVIPNCHFLRNLQFYRHNPHLSPAVPRVFGLYNLHQCPSSGNSPSINQWNTLHILDKKGEKWSPNISHYIFSADLTILTKILQFQNIKISICFKYVCRNCFI